jgi:predicted nucleic acid-binding protein
MSSRLLTIRLYPGSAFQAATFELFPVVAYPDAFFDDQKNHALELIGTRDPTDADLPALTLKLKYPLWSHDRDFQKIPENTVVTSGDLFPIMAKRQASNTP